MICWMNGQYIGANELMISPFDHGFLYGLGFFETMRTYQDVPVFLQDHFHRLTESLNMYRIYMPYTLNDIAEVMHRLNELNGGGDGYFRINVSAGVHDLGLATADYPQPTVIIFRKPLVLPERGTEKQAVLLKTVRNKPETEVRSKSHHFGNNVLARMELPNLSSYEGVFLTEEGYVAEGITSNIFWAKHGVLYTPALATGILPGITRKIIMTLAKAQGYEVREGLYDRYDIQEAHECFVTNSIQELVPISSLEHKSFAGAEGAIYQRLHQSYIAEIRDIIKGR
ncbi:aminodeoxychorismate lyase [Metasolibacillus fluoroglycofenilyticus]|uniref:aminodeoxychorismate lyase n=1 Tax=Metasolibacillus fluoroglycofenilyticus TaxID=1239396 RepID=UPI000D347A3C|nr:aminodeoxychorismate lyase [Metasolibacillus fluoroglycofenilyticus]